MTAPLEFDASLAYRPIQMERFNALIGPILFAANSESEWRFYLDLDDRHANVGGVCHGGVLMSLADIGMGAAAFRAVGRRPVATIAFNAQFVSAAKSGGRVHGRSNLIRWVKEIVFMESDLWFQDRQVMNATGIWKVLDKTFGVRRNGEILSV